MTDAELSLGLQISPVLAPASTVRLLVDERVVATRTVADLRAEPRWRVAVPATVEPLLSVRLETSLSISANRCDDHASGNLWIVVSRDSGLTFTARPGRASVRDFFRFPGGRIVVSGSWGNPQQQAASIGLFSAVRWLTRGVPVDVVLGADATPTPTAGPVRAERAVRLLDETQGAPVRLNGDTLWVRGDAATLRLLTTSAGSAALLGAGVESIAAAASDDRQATCGANRLCLSDPSTTELYLMDATPAMARAMALVAGALSAQSRRAVTSTLADPSAFSRSRAGLRLVATPTPEKIAGLGIALSLAEAVGVRNRQTGRELLRATPDGALASLELAAGAPATLVLQSSRGADASTLEAFTRRVTDPRRFAALVGAVVVGNGDDVVALQFGAGGVEARPERLTWWDRYVVARRPWWYLLFAVLVFAALFLTWKRLGRRQPVSPPPM